MSSRADKAAKGQKDKHHTILRELVQLPENKTCAECLAKGPRWSSWSLGVFVCIRCAGIHRNLGVHISKMKSIDLDSWTSEQLQNVLRWGNRRAAEYFECYLPKDFTRPQATHALESFIRNKYERKLYIKKDGEPPENPKSTVDRLKSDNKEEKEKEKKPAVNASRQRRAEKKLEAPKQPANTNKTILNMASKTETNKLSPAAAKVADQHNKSHSMNDLLSLDNPAPVHDDFKHSASSNDLLNFGCWSDPVPAASNNSSQSNSDPFFSTTSTTPSQPSNDLFASQGAPTTSTESNAAASPAPAKSTKESILSLYGSGTNLTSMAQQQQQQPQMFGVPGGMYTMNNMNPYQQQQMPQQQPANGFQQQQPNTGFQQQGIMNNQMNQMNMQMQQMNFNQQQQPPQQQQQFMNQQQQNFNAYKQQPQQQQMMYNAQQQQQQRQQMMNAQQINSLPQQQQQQQNFNMMGQQQNSTNMGNNMAGWGQQPQQQPQQQQQQMFNGMNNGFGAASSNSGTTMNNLLWN